MNKDFYPCQKQTDMPICELNKFGFKIIEKKYVSLPSQIIVFIGVIIDSVEFKVYLTDEKIQTILKLSQITLSTLE
jgi:hypothetical protein